ncbi:hypothetical protein TVAG_324890 [Trichomonas vaginalis G3]|uniref:Uncharacterized protein n=1 Tax=Trichomonas vaginalis (strain ATCC PRA-98 / G3) TaxID=412133 RepID=A2F124_TRIV3|nr:hypothetical protein TVAGG3_0815030 [Trichomonas vaginalis G3]EAY01375.1 hypothetical protein TVAG_324890 [Trichomonas vaginalis G3]KAI5497475.1 hypothetical protein TVAGG3_0815030 [Trichomonas vaginalis G3]|eukprot:XP_001314117.1 hypothetical protein [Trichomonas vaginalis G3]
MNDLIANIIDETAEQIRLFLNLDKLSSSAIVDEIKNENDLLAKIGKFMKLVIDRISFSKDPVKYYNSMCANIMGGVRKILPNAPETVQEFSDWLPAQLEQHKLEIRIMKKKLRKCQEALIETKNSIAKQAYESTEKSKDLEQQLKHLKKENKQLKERYMDREDFLQYHKSQVSIAESKQQRAEQSSFELQKNNYDLKLKLFDLQSTIDALKRENSELKKQIRSTSEQNQYDILERNELLYQIDCYHVDAMKIEKLQNLPCKCFEHGKNWTKAHKQLHRELYQLEQENEELKARLSDVIAENNTLKYVGNKHNKKVKQEKTQKENVEQTQTKCCSCCKCKCHYLDVNSLKKRFDDLESDVEELRKEIDGK